MGAGSSGGADAGFRLLERGPELARLDDVLASPRSAGGRNLLLTGPAGIGKTRLLNVLADRAEASSFLTLRATCIPLEREFSFGVAVSLFDRHIRDLTSKQRDRLLTGAAARARPIFEGGPSGAGDAQLFPLLHGLYWLAANAAAESPLLLAVDDAQWADVSSLRYLNFLAQRIDELPMVLAVSFRSGEADGERAELLESLIAGTGDQLEPEPLSQAAVGELVRDELPQSTTTFCAACAEATGGNPFLLRELIDEMQAEGVSPSEEAAERVARLAPSSLRRAVLLRLGQLHDSAIALAKAVAVLGGGAELRHAAELAALDLEDAGQAADALAANGILKLSDGVSFVHPLIASTVYAELGTAERGRLHRRSAARLMLEGARAERIAAHLLPATREADPEVVTTLREAAADALLRGSPGPAVAYLERALREPPRERGEVLLELGGAQMLAGLGAEAIATHTEALERVSGPRQLAKAHHALGHAQYAAGELMAAAANFSAGADAAAAEDPDLALRIQADLISIGILVPELHGQIAPILPEAIERAREGETTAAGRAILASAALLSVLTVEPAPRALSMAEEALDEGRLIADEGSEGATIYSVTGVLTFCGELSRSVEVLDRVVEEAVVAGSVMGYATAIYSRSYPQLERGRVMAAIADARAAIDARRFGWRQFLPVAYSIQMRALLERGDIEEARTVLAEAAEEDWGTELPWSTMLWARGALNLATGDPASALADFRAWGEAWPVPNPAFLAEWRSHAAVAAAVLGDREQAVELASEELALAERFGAAHSRGVALRALGLGHRGEQAIETLRAAVEALAQSEAALSLCRTRVDLGAALRREGRRADAREELRRGLDLAQRLGAVTLALRATDELKLAGARPRGRALSGADSLSAGELRVAAMAAEGMTNREIAQTLFVTPKAVQWHLTNTYRKLEISSREEIATALGSSSSS